MTTGKRLRAVFLVALLSLSVLGAGVATAAEAPSNISEPTGVNYGSDVAHDPQVAVTVEKAVHGVGWSPTEYEADDGSVKTLDAHVNDSVTNPVSLVATDINESDFGQFPRKSESDNAASALDASEWTKSGANSSKLSISDTTTAPNVEAVRFDTGTAMASGDVAVGEYANFSVSSDEAKRYLQLGVDITTLDSGTHIEIRVVDEDGDYKHVLIDPDNSTSSANVLANSTGDGQVLQHQLGKLSTTTVGGSDGTFDNIERIDVRITDGDVDMAVALVNAEKTGQYAFGEERYDGTDDDDTKDDTRTIYEPNGRYSITGVDTLGDAFSDATIHDIQYEMLFETTDLSESMDAEVMFSMANNYPSFEYLSDQYYRVQLPDAYDLSYSNARLTDDVDMPSGRYQTVEIAEGVSDTAFEDISSWISKKSLYDTEGANVTLDSTIQPGQQIAIHYEMPTTKGEQSNMIDTGGVAGQFDKDSSGGIWGFLTSLPGIGSILAAAAGIKLFRG